jgi:hypothetical protein
MLTLIIFSLDNDEQNFSLVIVDFSHKLVGVRFEHQTNYKNNFSGNIIISVTVLALESKSFNYFQHSEKFPKIRIFIPIF